MKKAVLFYLKLSFIIYFLCNLSSKAYSCEKGKDILRVALINDDSHNYEHYMYYMLGEYASLNSIEFKLGSFDNNPENFDIIFGDYDHLKKFSKNQIKIPETLEIFYQNNGIEIKNNLFPLDLDTFILISKEEQSVSNLEELINKEDPFKYTIGTSFLSKKNFLNLIKYNLGKKNININNHSEENILNLLTKGFTNFNKNILNSNYQDVYQSYENSENIFTIFSDGVLLYKNLDYKSFQLFPKSKFHWDEENGIFELMHNDNRPLSFYGFSAYLNNSTQSDFLCFMVSDKSRITAFQSFNLEISPLSFNEVTSIQEIPEKYREILDSKKNHITNGNISDEVYSDFINIILKKKKYINLIDNDNYFN